MSFQFLSCPFISLHCLSFHELKLKVPARPKNYTNFLVNLYRNWKSAKNQAKIVACIFFAHGLIFCKTEGWWERSIILFWLFWILALCGRPKFQKRLKLELVCILCLFLFFEFRPCPDWKLMGQVPLFCAFWFCRFCFCFYLQIHMRFMMSANTLFYKHLPRHWTITHRHHQPRLFDVMFFLLFSSVVITVIKVWSSLESSDSRQFEIFRLRALSEFLKYLEFKQPLCKCNRM